MEGVGQRKDKLHDKWPNKWVPQNICCRKIEQEILTSVAQFQLFAESGGERQKRPGSPELNISSMLSQLKMFPPCRISQGK